MLNVPNSSKLAAYNILLLKNPMLELTTCIVDLRLHKLQTVHAIVLDVVNPPVVQEGVKLPPGRSFRCCVVTVRNFGKRFNDFVGI
jgi:hypothetical protein